MNTASINNSFLVLSVCLHTFISITTYATVTQNDEYSRLFGNAATITEKIQAAFSNYNKMQILYQQLQFQPAIPQNNIHELLIAHIRKAKQRTLSDYSQAMHSLIENDMSNLPTPRHLNGLHPVLLEQQQSSNNNLHSHISLTVNKLHYHERLQALQNQNIVYQHTLQQSLSYNTMHLGHKRAKLASRKISKAKYFSSNDQYVTLERNGIVKEYIHTPGYGISIVIEHSNGDISIYGKLQHALVALGQKVMAGMHLGISEHIFQKITLKHGQSNQ